MKRWWIWAGAGLLTVIVGAGAYFWLFAKGQSPSVSPIKPVESTEQKERMKLEQAAISRFAQKAGEVSFRKLQRSPAGWIMHLEAKDQLKNREEVLQATKQLLVLFKQSGVPLADVQILFLSNFVRDRFGRRLTGLEIARIGFTKSVFQKIDWEYVIPDDLPALANVFWLHPLITTQGSQHTSASQAGGSKNTGG